MHEIFRFNVGDSQCLAVNDGNSAGKAAWLRLLIGWRRLRVVSCPVSQGG